MAARIIQPGAGDSFDFGGLGVDWKVDGGDTGAWVFKPRGQWHTFWNAGDEPCEIIETISPAELEMDFDSVPGLCEHFDLTFPEL